MISAVTEEKQATSTQSQPGTSRGGTLPWLPDWVACQGVEFSERQAFSIEASCYGTMKI